MIIPDAKKAANIIVGKMGSPLTHEEKPEADTDPHEGALHALSSEILSAHEAKSPQALTSALKAFIEAHRSHSEDSEY